MAAAKPTIHASAVLVGAKAALIRGPSGSGKSRLAWSLVTAATEGLLRFARLVSDDRTHLESHSGRLLARPAQALEGMVEIHGLPNGWTARQLNHPSFDWTDGCIAVTNAEMDRVWARVDAGTPIEIHP